MISPIALAKTKSLCVFDLLGANGPIYAQMKDYKIAAMDWGVDFQLKPYLSEKAVAVDFKSGLCDAASSMPSLAPWMLWAHCLHISI